ncbi:MAG: hypothetical protein LBT19_02100 [Candidatus Nomurabacteria bacterium]|jgi:uncharacterized membrane protein YhdT|nr:hypothetical protein [Candidatus Nomurabacteria bacterium]
MRENQKNSNKARHSAANNEGIRIVDLILSYVVSWVVTLCVFGATGWYSFNTLPTELVFLRMVFLSLILTVIIEMVVFIVRRFKKN